LKITVSDYITEFLINKKITDVFGYPGGAITYFMESLDKYSSDIKSHLCYHEQAASFAACGYAQISNKPGVAFATSGPGATNLITGIANAFFDSIPCIFITGQVHTYNKPEELESRQIGFQETDIVNIVKPITQYAKKITNKNDIKYALEKAYYICVNGRPGPVLLDIPIDIQRAEIDSETLINYKNKNQNSFNYNNIKKLLLEKLSISKKPIILAGNGINLSNASQEFNEIINKLKIPVVTSMIAVDLLDDDSKYNFGFIGAYGHRYSNIIINNSDLIISIGSRLDKRQTGDKETFAVKAQLIRIDIDKNELTNKIKEDEIDVICDIKDLFLDIINDSNFKIKNNYLSWLKKCNFIKETLLNYDKSPYTKLINDFSKLIPNNATILTDVGQNQVWVSQHFNKKNGQRILFSGGHGAMGYSLPASIGAFYANPENIIISINGDGGFQMNLQELQLIVREKLPIKIIIFNNNSLGMIRHFQEMYFNSNYVQTIKGNGYLAPDFCKLAKAYGIRNYSVSNFNELFSIKNVLYDNEAVLININLDDNTYVLPKLANGKPIYDQDPLIDRNLLNKLMNL
jgi:acetolactate synthase-1/2/3 large subunit